MRQGRTDAWIAHQLEVSVKDLRQFKRDHDLEAPDGGDSEGAVAGADDLDLRAEDDALVGAALDAESEDDDDDEDEADSDEGGSDDDGEDKPKRRRGRRGGRGRRGNAKRKDLEGTFDHGEEGYGLWLDPAIADDPVYAEHWAGHRPVAVTVEADRIVIKRAGEDAESSNGDGPSGSDSDD